VDATTLLSLTVVGAVVTTAGTLVGLFLKEVLLVRSFERWKVDHSRQQIARRLRDPIVLSALELCTRLARICEEHPADFLRLELLNASRESPTLTSKADDYYKQYTFVSSIYRLCAFLGWVELFRQEMVFFSEDNASRSSKLQGAIYSIRGDLADGQLNTADDWSSWCDGLIFREEQRAIGESMLVEYKTDRVVMGYGQFYSMLLSKKRSSANRWFGVAAVFLSNPQKERDFRLIRMYRMVDHLVGIVEHFAPDRLRPEHHKVRETARSRLSALLSLSAKSQC
jgi:hypothetical protein